MSRSNVPSPQADEFSNAVTSHNHPFPTSPDQNSPRLAFAIAMVNIPMLPSELLRLAWLSLDSQEGREYWKAMELMGQYAAANHACIHRHIAENLGASVLLDLENHHATPAGEGTLGIIPGSMASPGFVVSGKGNAESLDSASHDTGRAT